MHLPLPHPAKARGQIIPFEYTTHRLVRSTQECAGDLAVVAAILDEGVAMHLN